MNPYITGVAIKALRDRKQVTPAKLAHALQKPPLNHSAQIFIEIPPEGTQCGSHRENSPFPAENP